MKLLNVCKNIYSKLDLNDWIQLPPAIHMAPSLVPFKEAFKNLAILTSFRYIKGTQWND